MLSKHSYNHTLALDGTYLLVPVLRLDEVDECLGFLRSRVVVVVVVVCSNKIKDD